MLANTANSSRLPDNGPEPDRRFLELRIPMTTSNTLVLRRSLELAHPRVVPRYRQHGGPIPLAGDTAYQRRENRRVNANHSRPFTTNREEAVRGSGRF